MDHLEQSLIEWVKTRQLNNNQLKRRCKTLVDLSDGLLLYELLSKVQSLRRSSDHFDMEFVTLQVKDNWALKLSNLRRLKKNLDSYLVDVLQSPRELFEPVDLSDIARNGTSHQTLKLLKLVVYALVNCPTNQEFIEKIISLDQVCQISLMHFIQGLPSTMQEEVDQVHQVPNDEICIKKTEYQQIRREKLKLMEKIQELERQMIKLQQQKEKLSKDKEELKSLYTDLEMEMNSRVKPKSQIYPSVNIQLEHKLSESQLQLSQLQTFVKVLRRQHQTEIATQKDQIDIANARLVKLAQVQNAMAKYRTRVEKIPALKEKIHQISKLNQSLRNQLNQQNIELGETVLLKRALQTAKSEVYVQKERSEGFLFNLRNKEKQIKVLQKKIQDLEESENHLTNRIFQLEEALQEENESEDSIVEPVLNVLESKEEPVRRGTRTFTQIHVQSALNRVNQLYQQLTQAEQGQNQARESKLMMQEEFFERFTDFQLRNSQLTAQNQILCEQLAAFQITYQKCQEEKVEFEQLKYEFQELKQSKFILKKEVDQIFQQKENYYKQLSNSKEQIQNLHTQIGEKTRLFVQKQIQQKILQSQIQSYKLKEKTFQQSIQKLRNNIGQDQSFQLKYLQIQTNFKLLQQRVQSLQLQLQSKQEMITQLNFQKEESCRLLEETYVQKVEKIQKDSEFQLAKMVQQTKQAVQALNKDREQLQVKLSFARANSKREWQQKLSFSDPRFISQMEIEKLKEEIKQKNTDIEYLIRANQELKQVWKDTAKMLKKVWKELGLETRKMERAIRRRRKHLIGS